MFNASGLAVSLPAKELTNVRLTGSLFKAENLATAAISDELRLAIWLVERACEERRLPLVFIARPEIFTHGEMLDWLYEKLGGVQDHLCISDGSTIRLIPGLRNHVFFHALGRGADAGAHQRLERRVPELFSTVASQVNTALRYEYAKKKFSPPTIVLPGRELGGYFEPEFYTFYFNSDSLEDSAARSLFPGPLAIDRLTPFAKIIYVPMTEAATADADFAKLMAQLITRAYFDRSLGVFFRLPFSADKNVTTADRMRTALAGLRGANAPIPRVVAQNIFFTTDDVDPAQFPEKPESIDLLVHDSFDFWRHPLSFYAIFEGFQVMMRRGRHHPVAFPAMLETLCGRKPEIFHPPLLPRQRS